MPAPSRFMTRVTADVPERCMPTTRIHARSIESIGVRQSPALPMLIIGGSNTGLGAKGQQGCRRSVPGAKLQPAVAFPFTGAATGGRLAAEPGNRLVPVSNQWEVP